MTTTRRRQRTRGLSETQGPWVVATDGSHDDKAGWGSWAWFAGTTLSHAGAGPCSSSTEAEMRALLAGLRAAPPGRDVLVLADCKTVIEVLFGETTSKPRRGRRHPALTALWKDIDHQVAVRIKQGLSVEVKWVRAHCGHGLNAGADRLARSTLRASRPVAA